jgi:hypothetical protein
MFNSEPELSGIRAVAEKFFDIAREYSGSVPDDPNVVVRASPHSVRRSLVRWLGKKAPDSLTHIVPP